MSSNAIVGPPCWDDHSAGIVIGFVDPVSVDLRPGSVAGMMLTIEDLSLEDIESMEKAFAVIAEDRRRVLQEQSDTCEEMMIQDRINRGE